jgi:hypothetical protein
LRQTTFWFLAAYILLISASPSKAFSKGKHKDIVRAIWNVVPEIPHLLDHDTVVNEVADIDSLGTNDDANQYRHSMRSHNQSLSAAQQRTADYVEDQMRKAVAASRRSDKTEASLRIGDILHAVQDEKHDWTSCNVGSNGAASRKNCGGSTKCDAGDGNHGLDIDCWVHTIPQVVTWQANPQTKTDDNPPRPMQTAAETRSIEKLNEFVKRVTSTP